MSEYFDCLAWKETKGGKKYAVRLGSARPKDGGGFWVDLDAVPAPTDGRYSFSIAPQRPKTSKGDDF